MIVSHGGGASIFYLPDEAGPSCARGDGEALSSAAASSWGRERRRCRNTGGGEREREGELARGGN